VRVFSTHLLATDQIENGPKPVVILNDYITYSEKMDGLGFLKVLTASEWKDVPHVGISAGDDFNKQLNAAGAAFCIDKHYVLHAFDSNYKGASTEFIDSPRVREMMANSFLSSLKQAISSGRSAAS
jgi:hypothetical protein